MIKMMETLATQCLVVHAPPIRLSSPKKICYNESRILSLLPTGCRVAVHAGTGRNIFLCQRSQVFCCPNILFCILNIGPENRHLSPAFRHLPSELVSQICQEAVVAKGTFYVHFQSKEDIIKASYYYDMDMFIERHYANYLILHPAATVIDKINIILNSELEFADFAGYELTCLVLLMQAIYRNVSRVLSQHYQRRKFPQTIKELINVGTSKNLFNNDLTQRGMTAIILVYIPRGVEPIDILSSAPK